jgi:formylglycine-generating enzyme required for sulfatase activity
MYGHNGGVWEWTSTPLAGYPGYVPSELYPGYSADFFDGKHYVVVSQSERARPEVERGPERHRGS